MVHPNGFIKEDKLYILEEYHRTTDLLDLSSDIEKFRGALSKIKESCVVGLIGKLGSGKTTFINQFIGSIAEPVFQFEAWKYPGRKDLWENFVLEIANQLGKQPKFLKKIDGTQNNDAKTLVDMIANLPGGWLFPGIKSIGDGVKHFLEVSPATRTFQLQELLTELLQSVEGDTIYIAIEDADRAGDEGLFFLETLSYYVKEVLEDKKIVVISLIGEENYSHEEKRLSFQKCIDLEFDHIVQDPSFEYFVSELFIDEIVNDSDRKGQIVSFFEGLFREMGVTTMRMIKRRLRKANLQYQLLVEEQKSGIDRRVCILLECAKGYKTDNTLEQSYFDLWKQQGEFTSHSTVFGALLNCVIYDNHSINQRIVSSIYKKDHTINAMKLREWERKARNVTIIDTDYLSVTPQAKDDPIWYYADQFDREKQSLGLSKAYFK